MSVYLQLCCLCFSRADVKTTDVSVQTGLDLEDMILKYYWTTDKAIPSVAASQHTKSTQETLVDPPKIAGMAVGNDALEG